MMNVTGRTQKTIAGSGADGVGRIMAVETGVKLGGRGVAESYGDDSVRRSWV